MVRTTFKGLMLAAVGLLAIEATSARALSQARPSSSKLDSVAVMSTVESFQAAISRGDSAGAASLIDKNAVVLESGELESRSEYLAHHLGADIAFAKAVLSMRRVRSIQLAGSAAWVVSTSVTKGTFRGAAIDSEGAELIVLRKTAGKWLIAAIHWSSHRKRAP